MIARPKLAMGLFLSSESVFFLLLILSFVFYRASPTNLPGATPASSLDARHTGIFTACLLASSVTVWLAGFNLKRGRHGWLRVWLLITVVLGAVFLYGQASEYIRLVNKQVLVSKDVFAGAFFTLTGFHGFHVFVGLVVLLIFLGLAQGGDFKDKKGAVAFDTMSWYWHFVDAVWVVIFSVVYLWAAL
ncbi:MAG TPA: cytochrome c oxidase subunit 3 [Chloroflexota bacterium]|nr:cytochrome c oxidase subunit 3 [Chloroflexota bacterium]